MTLTDHLIKAYACRVGQSKVSSTADFVAAVEADGDLRAELQQKRAGLTDAVTAKCFCSRMHRDILDDVLRQTA